LTKDEVKARDFQGEDQRYGGNKIESGERRGVGDKQRRQKGTENG